MLKTAYLPNQTCEAFAVYLGRKLYLTPTFSALRVDHENIRPGVVASRAALFACILVILQPRTRTLSCAARVLQSVRGWHRSECKWLALSSKFNVKQHRSVARQLVWLSSWRSNICLRSSLRCSFGYRMRRIGTSVVQKRLP